MNNPPPTTNNTQPNMNPPNAAQPPRRKRRPATDPMRPVYRPMKTVARQMVPLTQMNEPRKDDKGATATTEQPKTVDQLKKEFKDQGAMSFPLVVTRRDLKEFRHHVMRLQAKGQIDIQDDTQFTAPIRLHRRDPRAPPSGAGSHFDEEDTKEDVDEQKERERIEQVKEERRKIREGNLAQIAPSAAKKPQAFQKKTEQKFRPDDTPEAEKRRLLKYEETLPWHLEDFDNKQTWYGTYESELSESHVMLTTAFEHGRDVIQMVPLERWYRFQNKSKVAKMATADQADEALKKEQSAPSFLTKIEIKREKERLNTSRGAGRDKLRTRVGGGADDEGAIRRIKREDDDVTYSNKRDEDADVIDFDLEEDFADDEEGLNGLFEGEETDVKESTDKVKREQLAASVFELRNEADIYRQEEKDKAEAEMARQLEKGLRKTLIKREKQMDYYDDEDSNPYASSSSDESDSEAERQRTKEEEERKAAEAKGNVDGDKPGSGASTKGSNTPSGAQKPPSKKRPGSANLSEASGNESSRKKQKKKHDKALDGSRKSTLINDSKRGAGSGSDSEMTDASKPKKGKAKTKLKVKMNSATPSGSPSGSRAGSPAAPPRNGTGRADSPPTNALGNASPKQPILPSAQEIFMAIPKEGMTITDLISVFKSRVGPSPSNTQLFIRLVKAVANFDKGKGRVFPLPEMPSEAHIEAILKGSKPKPANP